jgi:alkaline phosphatase D
MTRPPVLLASVSRRATLAGIAGAALLSLLPAPVFAAAADDTFRHGVASGDPDTTSVVLWTRVSDVTGPMVIAWELAADPDFERILRSGKAETGMDRDFTVKVLADRLPAGGVFWYRFHTEDKTSPIGRTRTLPTGRLDRLGIALASCSNYAFGFFNAYDAIASDADVEFVLHTGDYIYEYGGEGSWGDGVARRLGRVHEPVREIVSLDDYRIRHAQYKTDAGSRAMHAAHPLLCCWDDHESANNPWTGGAQNHQSASEGDWESRREASLRAYYEWMPIREPEAGRTRAQFWRDYSFGDLATLFTLETRHTARALQIDYAAFEGKITSMADARRIENETVNAPGRLMLAPELETDLEAALARSVKARQPWRLIGNQIPIARMRVPDVVALGLLPDPDKTPDASKAAKELAWKGKWNLPFYPDTWDGYEWARERLYALSRRSGAGDLIFLTGDSHSFWANRLADAKGRPSGIELGTAGITSPGDFLESAFGPETARKLDRVFTAHNPEVVWTDNMHQGYVRLVLARTGAQASFVAVDTVLSPLYRTHTLKRYAIARERGALRLREGSPS